MPGKSTESFQEWQLSAPVRAFLERNGYTVRSEVHNCDIAATKDEELVVIELKRNFTTSLLLQATQRQRAADSVYVGIPVPRVGLNGRKYRQMCHLLRRLELGLILIDPLESRMEVAFHPLPAERRRDTRTRRAILKEMAGRSDEYNNGGSTRVPLVTAYREEALEVAVYLREHGALSPAALRGFGSSKRTQSILHNNHYGWFERVDRGMYDLTAAGVSALDDYPALARRFEERLRSSAPGTADDDPKAAHSVAAGVTETADPEKKPKPKRRTRTGRATVRGRS